MRISAVLFVRGVIQFSTALSSNSATLRRILKADLSDLKLEPLAKRCWASDILRTFEGLQGFMHNHNLEPFARDPYLLPRFYC